LFGSQWLFITIALFFSFLKVVLKGLKQFTYNSYRACDVWNGNMIMSKPNYCTYFIVSMITCDPCPSRINRCWLNWNMPPKIDLLKNGKNSLNRKEVIIHALLCKLPCMFLFYNA
jgi:hypothetical protein